MDFGIEFYHSASSGAPPERARSSILIFSALNLAMAFAMRLKVVYHLKLVLNVSEKEISLRKSAVFLFGEKPMRDERPQGLDGVPFPQSGGPSSGAKLKRLDDELDFPDSAEPQLDVAMRLIPA